MKRLGFFALLLTCVVDLVVACGIGVTGSDHGAATAAPPPPVREEVTSHPPPRAATTASVIGKWLLRTGGTQLRCLHTGPGHPG